jgi:homoprotocatechuate degradation regulator HpaR
MTQAATLREFERSLPMALLRAREAVMRQFRPILAEHGLTEQQWRVLRALTDSEVPLSAGEIAERTLLLGPSLSRMLRTLESSELVTRTADPDDARSSHIALTRQGKRLVNKVGPLSEVRYQWITDQVGPDRLDELYELLHLVAALD